MKQYNTLHCYSPTAPQHQYLSTTVIKYFIAFFIQSNLHVKQNTAESKHVAEELRVAGPVGCPGS